MIKITPSTLRICGVNSAVGIGRSDESVKNLLAEIAGTSTEGAAFGLSMREFRDALWRSQQYPGGVGAD